MLTDYSFRQLTAHIAGAGTAMAGATIAASVALACSLGEACVRLNTPVLGEVATVPLAERLAAIRGELRAAGETLVGQDRLCQMPADMGRLAIEAACLLQGFRPLIQRAQDDLEMAIRLLDGAAHAALLLLDSNLRIWPEPVLLARYEPVLAALWMAVGRVQPAKRVRQ